MNNLKRLSKGEAEEAYQDGYRAGCSGDNKVTNPYSGLAAEFWSDGYEDAVEDSQQ